MRTLVCRHCGRQVLSNKKLKHLTQHYCGNKACQSARKLSFDRHKYKTNRLFRSHKLQGVRDRKKTKKSDEGNPFLGSHYQSSYRGCHPAYVLETVRVDSARTVSKRTQGDTPGRNSGNGNQEMGLPSSDFLFSSDPGLPGVYGSGIIYWSCTCVGQNSVYEPTGRLCCRNNAG